MSRRYRRTVATETAPVDIEPTPTDPTTTEPTTEAPPSVAVERPSPASMGRTDKMPIKMLNDRILVRMGGAEGERRSNGGILIPATAQMGKRLTWAEVVAVGPNVRAVEEGDQVLFNPEDRYEVEVRGEDLIILRERDIHAVAAPRLAEGSTGLYL
jgi:chaperonin GroES